MAAGSDIRTIAALCTLFAGCDRPPSVGEQDMDALPVLVAEAESRIGSFEDPDVGFSVVSGVDAVARALRGAMTFPEFQIEIQSVWLAQDGSLWLRRWVVEPDDHDVQWLVRYRIGPG